MKWGSDRPYGLGMSRDTHIVFVSVYLTVILLLACFGGFRFFEAVYAAFPANSGTLATVGNGGHSADMRFAHRSFYPVIAMRLHQEGVVRLSLHVLPDGTVGDAHLLRSSGSAHLDAAALISVGNWRYRPAVSHGKETSSDVVVEVRYKLTG